MSCNLHLLALTLKLLKILQTSTESPNTNCTALHNESPRNVKLQFCQCCWRYRENFPGYIFVSSFNELHCLLFSSQSALGFVAFIESLVGSE